MEPRPTPTVVCRCRRRADELEVALVELTDPAAPPLASARLALSSPLAATLVDLDLPPTDLVAGGGADRQALASRLLDGCADELRAEGRRRVTATVPGAEADRRALLAANRFVPVRTEDGRHVLVREL